MDIIGNRTVRDLWHDLARDRGEATFLEFEDRAGNRQQYTYAHFNRLIDKTANVFAGHGIGKGTAVAVHMHNCPELLQCMFALAKLGAIMVPLHHRATRDECAALIEQVGAAAVVCEPDSVPVHRDGPIAGSSIFVARGRASAPMRSFEAERDQQSDHLGELVPLDAQDPALLVFTSGTTARPKGVVITHCNLLFSGLYVDWEASIRSEDRLLTTMPACHVNFQLNALMPVLSAGATLIAIERYRASRFWRQVCDYRATIVQSIAMIVRTQLLQPEAEWEKDHAVREVLYYLPLADELKLAYEERFATRLLNSYGTSETMVGVITDPPVGPRRWPAIGRVGLGYEARIADESGRCLPPGATGEIQVRGVPGRTVMKEYYRNPEATEALYDDDGWMHTGDLGRVDDDGWFYYVDRLSNLIKRAGENVSPAEVEAVIAAFPGVADVAVVGVPDPIHDQAVKAFVLPSAGAEIGAEELRRYCGLRLAAFKVPTEIEFVDQLPRTVSFKVARSALASPSARAAATNPTHER